MAELDCAISELSIRVPAPRPHCAIRFQRYGVIPASGDCDNAREAVDLHGRQTVGVRAVAQLPRVVAPPRPHCPVGLEGNRVISSRSNCYNIEEAADLPRYHVVLC